MSFICNQFRTVLCFIKQFCYSDVCYNVGRLYVNLDFKIKNLEPYLKILFEQILILYYSTLVLHCLKYIYNLIFSDKHTHFFQLSDPKQETNVILLLA